MQELKSCPFCGAKASIQRYSSGTSGPKCAVWCDACHVGTSWLHGDDGEERVVAEWNRRTSVAARELDVEAERPAEIDLPGGATLRYEARITGAPGWLLYNSKKGNLIRAMSLNEVELIEASLAAGAARSAAQGIQPESAPVSTEQAGDARDAARYRHIKADNHRCADNTFCLFLDLDGNLLPVASADMDAEIDAAMLEAAPSPNNSPVGGKSD